MNGWVRLYHDCPTDPKWRVIARKSGQRIGDVLAVWNFILVNASANANERGRTLNLVHEDIAASLDIEASDVDAIVTAMEGKTLENGRLIGWEKRNPIKDDGAAERAKRWRERKRTQTNGANALDTDTDTDTDISSLRSDSAKPKRAKPRTQIGDYTPSETERASAVKRWNEALRPDLSQAITEQIQKFRDHHISRGTKAADWPATWRTWVGNAPQFTKARAGPNGARQAQSREDEEKLREALKEYRFGI